MLRSPENVSLQPADAVGEAEGGMEAPQGRGAEARRGRRAEHVHKRIPRNLGRPVVSSRDGAVEGDTVKNPQARAEGRLHPHGNEEAGSREAPTHEGRPKCGG